MNSATWKGLALLTALLLAATSCMRTQTAEAALSGPEINDRLRATDKALRWLDDQQNADGGFGEGGSDPRTTCEAVLAFASAYEEPGTVTEGTKSPLDYLATQVVTQTNSAEGTALLILAVVAGNEDPRIFGSTDLIATLKGYLQGIGRYYVASSDGIAAQALAIMALKASKQAVPGTAVTWLKNRQNDDGGWGPLPGEASDTKNTALSIQALIAAGESPASQPTSDAILYLQHRQTDDAGFASSALASDSHPASTSQAIQALLVAGEDLFSNKWRRCLLTPFDALLDDQAGDGSFESSLEVTAAAVPGLIGRSLPLPGRFLAALKALQWLHTQQRDDGGFGNGGITADAVYAISLCDQDPDGPDWTKSGGSVLDALQSLTPDYIDHPPGHEPPDVLANAGELGKVIRAVHSAGRDPNNFAGRQLVDELKDTYDASTGRYHPNKVFSHDLALIALHAVSETIPAEAVTTLENSQLMAGGWAWAWGSTTSDVDSTGLSMQAIVAGRGPSSPNITDDAVHFLDSLRFPGGGYPDLAIRSEPNCDSTSLAIQGLLASGWYRQEPLLFPLETGAVASSWDALLAFQEPAGSFVASASVPESRLLATLEAIHALVSTLYPVYEPFAEGDSTALDTVHGRLTCGHGFGVVAPYSGDDNNDGSARLRYRVVGNGWSEWTDMGKGGLRYLELLDLQAGTGYEIEVAYDDPDGVSGETTQSLSIYMGKACIPMALRSYAG